MATVLDLGILNYFTPILIFIFIFVVIYALFEKSKIFGENKELHALIGFVLAIIFVLVKPLREFVTTITPWMVVLFLLIVFILLGVMMLGLKEKDVSEYISANTGVTVTVIVIIAIIFLSGLSSVFPDAIGVSDGDGFFSQFRNVVFNAKILGVLLVLIISYFVVRAVGYKK